MSKLRACLDLVKQSFYNLKTEWSEVEQAQKPLVGAREVLSKFLEEEGNLDFVPTAEELYNVKCSAEMIIAYDFPSNAMRAAEFIAGLEVKYKGFFDNDALPPEQPKDYPLPPREPE